jgi:hypothetical protein
MEEQGPAQKWPRTESAEAQGGQVWGGGARNARVTVN